MRKDVNGVCTAADPRRVPEAFPIESLKNDEAIELAYFGAQEQHPTAMAPSIEGSIPMYVRTVLGGKVGEGTTVGGATGTASWERRLAASTTHRSRRRGCWITRDVYSCRFGLYVYFIYQLSMYKILSRLFLHILEMETSLLRSTQF